MLGPSPYLFGYPNVYGDDGIGEEGSPYYWWFQYLKRHDGYRKCCEKDGRGKYSKLYKDFGDVRTDDFEDWFFNHGSIFKEPEFPDPLAEVTHMSQLEGLDWNSVMVVISPIRLGTKMLSKREIKRQFSEIVDRRFKDQTPGRPAFVSLAKYRIASYTSLQTLKDKLAVLDLRLAEPDLTLSQIGERLYKEGKLESVKEHVQKDTDVSRTAAVKRMVMANIISRHLRDARDYIDSSVTECFPVKPPKVAI